MRAAIAKWFIGSVSVLASMFRWRQSEAALGQEMVKALKRRDQATVAKLLERGFNIQVLASLYGSVLHTVCRMTDGHVAILELFLKYKASPLDRDNTGNDLFDTCVIEARDAVARLLLRHGIDLPLDREIPSCLDKAIRYEQTQLFFLLLQSLLRQPGKHAPVALVLHKLVLLDRVEWVRSLLTMQGLNTDYLHDFVVNQEAGIIHSAQSSAMLQCLANAGFDVHQPDVLGLSPITKYLVDNRDDMVQACLRIGQSDVTESQWEDWISAAIKNDNQAMLQLLLAERAANSASHGNLYSWALVLAVEERASLDIAKTLIAYGARLDGRDYSGRTALMMAAIKNNPYYIRYLLKLGANTELVCAQGMTALLYAVRNNSQKCVKALFDATRAIYHKDKKGFDIAFHCAVGGAHEMASFLTRSGIELDRCGSEGHTTLMVACMAGNKHMVEFLLKSGADVDAQDGKQRTALMYACGHGFYDIVRLLLMGGANTALEDAYGNAAVSLAKQQEMIDLLSA